MSRILRSQAGRPGVALAELTDEELAAEERADGTAETGDEEFAAGRELDGETTPDADEEHMDESRDESDYGGETPQYESESEAEDFDELIARADGEEPEDDEGDGEEPEDDEGDGEELDAVGDATWRIRRLDLDSEKLRLRKATRARIVARPKADARLPFAFPRLPFERVVRETAQYYSCDLRFTPDAMEAIQEAAEEYLAKLFEAGDGLRLRFGRGRATLVPADFLTAIEIENKRADVCRTL